MKLEELVEIFRTETDDLDAQGYLWTDDEVLDFANDAQNEACRRARLLVDATDTDICRVAITAGTASYPLDARVIFVRWAKLSLQNYSLKRAYVKDLTDIVNWQAHTGTPTNYVTSWETGKILLYRSPVVDDTLSLRVVRMPLEEMDSFDDTPEINARYH